MGASDGPIFIVGAPRSGTTLLQYMLRSHPRISLPTGETHFMVPLYRNRAAYGDLSRYENMRGLIEDMHRRNAEFLDTDLHGMHFDIETVARDACDAGVTTVEGVFRRLLDNNARGEGKRRWGDKTPYYVLHIPLILEMFPDAQIIHIIRDGRDCALSMYAREHDFGVYNSYFAARYWQQYVETGQAHGRALPADVYMELRYEDLIRDPRAELERICRFLGEEYSDALVEYRKSGGKGKTPLLQQPIQNSNAEKWRSRMSPRQIRLFESGAGKTLAANGYPLVTHAEPMMLPLRAAFRMHNISRQWVYRKLNL